MAEATLAGRERAGAVDGIGTRELVLIADASAGVRDVLSLPLEDDGYATATAADGDEAYARALELEPDVILLDVTLPRIDGIEVLRRLRRVSQCPVILLGSKGGTELTVMGLDLGADDRIGKPFDPDELTARIRAVLRRSSRRPPVPARIIPIGDVEVDFERRLATRAGGAVKLGRTEWEVLRKLATNPGQVVLSTDLLREIWGAGYSNDLQVLRICISRLRRKLGGRERVRSPIRTYRNVGYALEP
jgi:DNA-binding response OmpR family regulator